MKLKVWSENTTDNENQLYVRLKETDRNDIDIIVCDKTGEMIKDGNLLFIDNDFKIVILPEEMNPIIPLKTDIRGSVLVYEGNEVGSMMKERAMYSFARQIKESVDEKDKAHRETAH